MKRCFALLSLLFVLSLRAQQPTYSVTPDRGPVTGGTEVTIKGQFGQWPYGVIFGSAHVPATRVNETTLVAVTPAHLPGTVPVAIFEYDIGITTGQTFQFVGDPESAFERVLLPVFTWPVRGAFGSEFRSDLTATLTRGERAEIYGLFPRCLVTCIYTWDAPYDLTRSTPEVHSDDLELSGDPGLFLYIPKDQIGNVAMNLRVHDTSRAAENFGTELPVVRDRDMRDGFFESITLIGIPSDARFRNTLRIYSTYAVSALVEIFSRGSTVTRTVQLRGGETLFQPAYAQFTDFPTDVETMRVRITVGTPPITLPPSPRVWAFVSVTNNETQHITTVTPQP